MASQSKSNFLLLLSAITLIIIIGGLFFSKYFSSASQPPSLDSTSNWKTYTNSQYGFSFKYPSTDISKDIGNIASKKETNLKYFEKDIKICKGCGYAGADEVERGLMTGVSVFSTTESLLSLAQRQFATKLDMNKVSNMTIDGKEATELVFPMVSPGTRGKKVLIKLPQNIVVAYFDVGYNTTDVEFNQYSQEFDQILSTFRFD